MRHIATEYLKTSLGAQAEFRPGQWEAIEALVRQQKRVLVVQRTGWGKSWVYFIATKMLRARGEGLTVIISPLLSLIRDQIRAIHSLGLRAESINSSNKEDWPTIISALKNELIDILLIAPERIANKEFREEVTPYLGKIGLFVVDEAHCISDWGHDFRPDYRRIMGVLNALPRGIPVLATTATANDRVVEDICCQLGAELEIQRGPLMRESLRLQVLRLESPAERLAWLCEHLSTLPRSGIIYCLTVRDCQLVAEWLKQQGHAVEPYYADLADPRKDELEQQLHRNEVKALVATVALGMGYDKPDLGFVVHYQRPGSVVAYYQQIGRAGRAVDNALVVLMNGAEDDEIQNYFIEQAFPSVEASKQVADMLDHSNGLTVNEILSRSNLSHRQVDSCLKLLEIHGFTTRHNSRYERTIKAWQPHTLDHTEITRKRRKELARMQELVSGQGCYMEFIAQELNDPAAKPCQRCAICTGDFLPQTASPQMVTLAQNYLSTNNPPIETRARWPIGFRDDDGSASIAPSYRLSPGLSLCIYNDLGYGKLVKQGKYRDNRFSDELVHALAAMIRTKLASEHVPTWVTSVPSLRHPDLVPDLANRLAAELGLSHVPVLGRTRDAHPQKTMYNSYQQVNNAKESLAVVDTPPTGPVLLIDDIVDSRWTLTVCGYLLRRAGSGPVIPVALATATNRGGDTD